MGHAAQAAANRHHRQHARAVRHAGERVPLVPGHPPKKDVVFCCTVQ